MGTASANLQDSNGAAYSTGVPVCGKGRHKGVVGDRKGIEVGNKPAVPVSKNTVAATISDAVHAGQIEVALKCADQFRKCGLPLATHYGIDAGMAGEGRFVDKRSIVSAEYHGYAGILAP